MSKKNIKKIQSFKFFNKKINVQKYESIYKNSGKRLVPPNAQRLKIFINLINKHKPQNIVDAGCGTAMPMIKILKLGYKISGYDKSKNMIEKAKNLIKSNGFDSSLVRVGNFENPKHIKNNSVDCILGMGTFYYSKNINLTLKNQVKKLKKNGRIIFSLRNELFDISTFNNYTINFFEKIYNINKYNIKVKKEFSNIFNNYKNKKNYKKNIDDNKVFSLTHNPLTVQNDLLKKSGLKMEGIYFYHFHCLPPFFENKFRKEFQIGSAKIEKPNSWKGYFLASGFIVDCKKK